MCYIFIFETFISKKLLNKIPKTLIGSLVLLCHFNLEGCITDKIKDIFDTDLLNNILS